MSRQSDLQREAEQGDLAAGLELAALKKESGEVDEARRIYEWLAVRAGLELADLREKSGRSDEARRLYEWLAVNLNSVEAAGALVSIGYQTGDYSSLPRWLLHIAAHGTSEDAATAYSNLTELARSSNTECHTTARAAIRTAADEGHAAAMIILALVASDKDRRDAARHWYALALEAGAFPNDELETYCGSVYEPEAPDGDDWAK